MSYVTVQFAVATTCRQQCLMEDKEMIEKRGGASLPMFIAGLIMLIAGLYMLSQRVMITSGFFAGGISIGRSTMPTGMVFVPLIAGLIWMFASGSKGSKILTGAGVIIILAAIIMSTRFYMPHMSLFDWVVLLVLVFGGAGLLIRTFIDGSRRD